MRSIRYAATTGLTAALTAAILGGLASAPARAEDKLLTDAVEFAGGVAFLGAGVPGMVIGAIRNGETAVAGFGETSKGSGKQPDGDTYLRIASISKSFCGTVLGNFVSTGQVQVTDSVQAHLPPQFPVLQKDGHVLRLLDLVTQTSGLPREVPQVGGTPDNPFGGNTMQAQINGVRGDPFLFPPSTGALYSNWGFDLLGIALGKIGGKPYDQLLSEQVLGPLGMTRTKFNLTKEDEANAMTGHFFDGSAMPFVPSPETIYCAGGLYSTTNDILKWLDWNLDKADVGDAAWRATTHAGWVFRDGLSPVGGLDDGGTMGAMALGWVIVLPDDTRPLMLNKSGGLQGEFSFVVMAPAQNVGVFISMNEFSISGWPIMVDAANKLIAELAPR